MEIDDETKILLGLTAIADKIDRLSELVLLCFIVLAALELLLWI